MSTAAIIIPQFAEMLGPREIILILAVLLLLVGAKKLPALTRGLGVGFFQFWKATRDVQDDLGDGATGAGKSLGGIYGTPVADALTHTNQTYEFKNPPRWRKDRLAPSESNGVANKLIVFIAQGLGIGRIPFAPGTWGTLLGFVWFGLLIAGGFWAYVAGTCLSVLGAVWICGAAERILGQRDPASVVLDEIVAVPICFLGLMLAAPDEGANTGFMRFISHRQFLILGTAFATFRLFDIWKPWPIRQSQHLPGGWGIVIDDVLAAAYVNLVMLAVWFFFR